MIGLYKIIDYLHLQLERSLILQCTRKNVQKCNDRVQRPVGLFKKLMFLLIWVSSGSMAYEEIIKMWFFKMLCIKKQGTISQRRIFTMSYQSLMLIQPVSQGIMYWPKYLRTSWELFLSESKEYSHCLASGCQRMQTFCMNRFEMNHRRIPKKPPIVIYKAMEHSAIKVRLTKRADKLFPNKKEKMVSPKTFLWKDFVVLINHYLSNCW